MKKIKLLILAFLSVTLFAQVPQPSWDFPFKPGSEKWKSLKSHNEMVAICQIPDDVIHSLSTNDLITICLDYPLFFTLTAFNNMQEGYEQVSNEFNGFKELVQRKDFGAMMLNQYKLTKTTDVEPLNTDLDKGKFMFRIFYLELMLSQNSTLKNLSASEMLDLLNESIRKATEKQELNASLFQIQSSFLLMARILNYKKFENFTKKISNQPSKYNSFLNTIFLTDREILTEIGKSATDFVKQAQPPK